MSEDSEYSGDDVPTTKSRDHLSRRVRHEARTPPHGDSVSVADSDSEMSSDYYDADGGSFCGYERFR